MSAPGPQVIALTRATRRESRQERYRMTDPHTDPHFEFDAHLSSAVIADPTATGRPTSAARRELTARGAD